jgi:hypothetical protein
MAMIKIETVDGKVNVAIGHATGTELIIEATSAIVSTINALIDEMDDPKEKEELAQFAFEKITMGAALLWLTSLESIPSVMMISIQRMMTILLTRTSAIVLPLNRHSSML